MAARSALASASVRPNGLTTEPALSSLPVATSRAWTAPSPLVNSITTRHRIALSPACLPLAKPYHPQVLDGFAESGRSRELAEAINDRGRRPNEAALGAFLRTAQAERLLGAADPRLLVRQFHGLLLGFLQIGVLLRIDEAPDAEAIAARARAATEALLTLHPAPRAAVRRTPAPARPR